MAIAKFLSTVAFVAALGAVSPALAASNGPADETGLTTLGIDISGVGGSSQAAQQFIAGLNADAQRSVINGCQTALANPVSYSGSVLAFCENAVSVESGPVLGFAPAAPIVAPAQPYEMPVLQPDTGEAY